MLASEGSTTHWAKDLKRRLKPESSAAAHCHRLIRGFLRWGEGTVNLPDQIDHGRLLHSRV